MHVYVSLEEILHQVTASLRAGDKPLSKAIMTRGTDASVRRKKSFECQISKLLHGLGVFFFNDNGRNICMYVLCADLGWSQWRQFPQNDAILV